MTTVYHNPLPANAPATAANLNAPLGQLDDALRGIVERDETLTLKAGEGPLINLLFTDTIPITHMVHRVSNPALSTIRTIAGGREGNVVRLYQASGSEHMVFARGGNLTWPGGDDSILTNGETLWLRHKGQWHLVNRSNCDVPLLRAGEKVPTCASSYNNTFVGNIPLTSAGTLSSGVAGGLTTTIAQTLGSVGASAGVRATTAEVIRSGNFLMFEARVGFGNSEVPSRGWVGLSASATGPGNVATPTQEWLGFYWDTSVDARWQFVGVGASERRIGSEMWPLVAANTLYLFRFLVGVNVVWCSIDGRHWAWVDATVLPSTPVSMGMSMLGYTLAGSARQFAVNCIQVY